VATHGRSLYIVDDIGALERLTPEIMAQAAYLFPIAPAFGFEPLPGSAEWGGAGVFRGDNPQPGARFDVWVGEFTGEPLKLSVKTPGGTAAATISSPALPGFNRLTWDLKPTKDVLNEYASQGSKFVAPGEYEVTLTFGSITQTQKVQVTIAKGIETR
ncbi:MAG TPA: hypothetical protein VHH91_00305, partial [Vicinamibacterales bacterium]|nr:hypothetical protein [Vicinamibacterales bacterium]